jgi:hypothetical protein
MFLRTRQLRWFTIAASPVAALLMISGHGQAQTRSVPNLSGTWQLVEFDSHTDKSDPKFPKMTLVIEQDSAQIMVTEKRIKRGQEEVRKFVYHVDGTADRNTGRVEIWPVDPPEYESVTQPDKNSIVTEYKRRWRLATRPTSNPSWKHPQNDSIQEHETWSIDASANKLTLRSSGLVSPSIVGGNTSGTMDPYIGNQTPSTSTWGTTKLVFRRIVQSPTK